MLKTALFDRAINKKCCSVDGGRGICPLFSSPHIHGGAYFRNFTVNCLHMFILGQCNNRRKHNYEYE